MNKSQLVDALADRLGDRPAAAPAVAALLQRVGDTGRAGHAVAIAGCGVFARRARAARTGRNPRTGETVDVPATTVPAFRPGTGFRNAVAGDDTRRRSAAATNGAGGQAAGTVLHGTVELTPATTTAVHASAADSQAKSRKKAPAEAIKDTKEAKGKKDKKGKKNKK